MAFKIPNPKESGLFRHCDGCSKCLTRLKCAQFKDIIEEEESQLELGIKMILKHQYEIKKKNKFRR